MHILESYALQNDLKIDKALLYEKFFPLAVDKYITIDTSSMNTSAMSYDHWQLVVDIIKPRVEAEGIQIVQLGEKNCIPLTGCYMAIGQCNFNQKAYVVKNSLLHLSSNNESSHIASHFNKKSVVLFPYNCYISQFKPYWSSPENLEILQGTSSTERPSYNPSESPKSINTIRPEEVAEKALRFLNIDTFKAQYRTLRIGSSFHRPRIESNLSHLLNAKKLGMSSLIMRMDLNFNEEVLVKQLQSCPCSIITNRPLNDFIINNYHKQIVELVYYITDDHDPEFIKKAKSKSITFLLRTRKDQQSIPDLKLDYFDFGMIQPVPEKSKNDFIELKDKNNLYYKSKHFIIHDNQFYPCTAALNRLKQGSPTMDHEPQEVIDDPIFWEEEEHFHFFEKIG
tara:strand:- start:1439 stop:2626 length:1188 start_codon:yes stop_codon:yes gene_type:complete